MFNDADYIKAIEYGLPQTASEAIRHLQLG